MFEGFSTPNYVQVPHEFFDIILEKDINKSAKNRGVSKSAIKVLAFMIRYTFGWQKAGFSLKFTFNEIKEQANMQKQQVNDGIQQCLENNWIERKEINGEMYYRLKLKDNDIPWELDFDWRSRVPRKEHDERYENHTGNLRYENHTETRYENHTESDMKIIPNKTPETLDTYEVDKPLKKINKKNQQRKDRERKREDELKYSSVMDESDLEIQFLALQEITDLVFGKPRSEQVDVESLWNHWHNRFPNYDLTHFYAVMRAVQRTARMKDDLTGIIVNRLPSAPKSLIPCKNKAIQVIGEVIRDVRKRKAN